MSKDGMHNLYLRGDTYWARKWEAGIEHRQSLRTTVPSVAKKRRDQFIENLSLQYQENRRSWKMAALEWDKRIAGTISQGTQTRYDISIKNVSPKIAHLWLDEINRATLSDLVSWRRSQGVINATIRRDLTAIASVLDVAESLDWIEGNPAREYAKRLKERRDPITLPNPQDINFVVSRAPGNFANIFRFSQYTGMRLSEITSLKHRQIVGNRIDLFKTKTNTPRSFDMDDRAQGTLEGTPKHIRSEYVFWHSEGEPYRNVSSQARRIIRLSEVAAKKQGSPFRAFRFHDLRHWFAVDYLRSGNSIYKLQKILGHASIKTTEIYLKHLTPEEADRAQ